MNTTVEAAPRPPIKMIEGEAEKLANLALGAEERLPQVAGLLLEEIERAELYAPEDLPPGVVTMMAEVEFVDEGNGTKHTLQLVYPNMADLAAGRISILTPVGAGLIGLQAGQSIVWPDRDGRERTLKILDVRQALPSA